MSDLAILYPNGQCAASQMFIWDTLNSRPVLWDGSVAFSGSIVISAVDQGAPGLQSWKVVEDNSLAIKNALVTGPIPISFAGGVTQGAAGASSWLVKEDNSLAIKNALDVALSTRLKAADTLAGVTTVGAVTAITNVVHVDDNAGSITVDCANLDVALSTRLKAADTLAGVTTVGAVTTITNPVAVTSAGLTNLDVALSTRLKPADTLAGVTTVGAVTGITNPVVLGAGSALIGNVNIDPNRTYIALYASAITGITTEGMFTFTKNVGGVITNGVTSYTITSGKKFKILSFMAMVKNTTTVANMIAANLRVGASVGASSPIYAAVAAAAAQAVATSVGAVTIPITVEILGDGSIQVGVSHLENVTTASIANFCLTGYEY